MCGRCIAPSASPSSANSLGSEGVPHGGGAVVEDALAKTPSSAKDIVVEGLEKQFGDGPPVLRGIDLSVRRGETVALIGANGAGKSTLMRCLLHLVKPDAGEVVLFGVRLSRVRQRELRRVRNRVGFVFQRHNLVPRLSALANVLHGALGRSPFGALHRSLSPAALRDEAMACLERVGLAHLARQRADTLSCGQSQRVAIARALMQRPEMLLADEPVASLDPAAGEEVMDLFTSLARQEGLTLVFTTHNMRHALTYAQRIVGLRDGRIALDRPTTDGLDCELAPIFA